MASSDLSEELICSICLCTYNNPVMLRCGHNFCKVCISDTFARKRRSGIYSCPECRTEFKAYPALQKNLKLCNIVDHYHSIQEIPQEMETHCTYCLPSIVPAVKTCLRCDASFCELHLKNHSKSADHIMIEPIGSHKDKKCPVHNELIKYFCVQDSSLLCTSCTMNWKHKGHKTELLNEASEKEKERLQKFIKQLSSITDKAEKRYWQVEENRNNIQQKSAGLKKRVTSLFGDIRSEVNDLENRVLEEITRQETCLSGSCSDRIEEIDKQIQETYRRKRQIDEVCKITDPLMFLKQSNVSTAVEQESPFYTENLNEELITVTLVRALNKLSEVIPEVKKKYEFNVIDSSDMILNVNTANSYLALSFDLKKAIDTDKEKSRSFHPERFTTQQVLATKRFSSGKHYWEIQTSDCGEWCVGVTYNSVKRKEHNSLIGRNPKSWCLNWSDEELTADHDDESHYVHSSVSAPNVGIYLDYDGGVVSFYKLSGSVQHLYTFSAHFTEPLYAAFYLNDDAWIKIAK
ncbi:E3 ubiquitin/ISG15 ligase TRIM25-like [Hyla sarda]|uniref:E3 ubiquitin/ISG15 ligase TRIM25-like n=1 Tax=Hyla sarda TaxID=327740 RepID=UPI0024C41344|nr:E3 ubiquitin/ISG15 ligase TRIM25-like [Hyla sarda]